MRPDFLSTKYLLAIDAFVGRNLEVLGVYTSFNMDPGQTSTGTDVDPDDDLGDSADKLKTFVSVEKVDSTSLEFTLDGRILRIGETLMGGFAETEAGTISIIDTNEDGEEIPLTERAVRYNLSRGTVKGWDLRSPETTKKLPASGLTSLLKSVAELIEAIEDQE